MTIADLSKMIREATLDELPELLGALEVAKAAAWVRLSTPPTPTTTATVSPAPPPMLTAEDAAALAGVSKRWLLRHTRKLRFRHDLSRKQARFEEAGLRRWFLTRGTKLESSP